MNESPHSAETAAATDFAEKLYTEGILSTRQGRRQLETLMAYEPDFSLEWACQQMAFRAALAEEGDLLSAYAAICPRLARDLAQARAAAFLVAKSNNRRFTALPPACYNEFADKPIEEASTMVYTIQNDRLCASVQSLGAQLCSLREVSTGREHLWQGDPAVWSGQAPLLFPAIGRLNGGKYRWAGQEYAMPKHGFARKKEFALESQSASQLTLLLRDDENTRAIYPFSFELRLTFALEGNALSVRHSVVNTGAGNMPFCLGAHPGFFCAEGDALALDAPETLALYRLDAEKMLLKPEPLPYPVPDGRISLSHALFQEDAMMFDGIRSRSITLLRQDGSRVRVEYGAAPCLGVWSQPKPPLRYVCLEPWYGLDDFVDFAGDFSQKPHCQVLAAGQSFAFPMRIVIGM